MHESPVIVWNGLHFDLAAILMIVVTCIIVYAIARIGTANLSASNPSKIQNFVEWIVDFVKNLISSTMSMEKGKSFIMLGITLIMFIFVGNMLGLPFYIVTEHTKPFTLFGFEMISHADIEKAHKAGEHIALAWWKSPTADASVTMGLALVVIIMTHYLGLTKNTKHYLKHYFEPYPIFFPLNVIKEVSKLLTLGLRLFGNIFAGEVMISVILMAGVFGIPFLLVWQGFSIFVGAIQAFVFTTLTMVYISQNIEHQH